MSRRLLLLFALPAAIQAAVAAAPVPAQRVDAVFAEWDRRDSPGCAATVVDDGKQVYRKGFGMASLELDVPIAPETVFYIASTSKQFAAASIALLAEQGRLALDDDVRKYVPELPDYGHTITVSHLVHHTSGLRDYLGLSSLAGRSAADSFPQALALRMIARQKATNYPPGSEYLYSNSNYFLLSLIVERVSGQSLREYADAHIFKPLGMARTQFYDDPERIVHGRTIGHTGNAKDGWKLQRTNFALVGDGGLLTTVDDLVQWERNFLDNRLGRGGPGLIRRLTRPGTLDDGKPIEYGFGLMMSRYRGLPTVSHGGSFLAYKADMLRFPEQRLGIFVLCNADAADPGRMSRAIADLYLADRFTEPAPAEPERRPPPAAAATGTVGPQQRERLAGRYYSEELDAFYTLAAAGDGLDVRVGDNPPQRWQVQGPDLAGQGWMQAHFTRDAGGAVDGFRLDAGRVKGLRFERRTQAGAD